MLFEEEIKLEILPSKQEKRLRGFAHFWMLYVNGWNPKTHCIKSLVGERNLAVNPQMQTGITDITCNGWCDYIYICGVAYPMVFNNNFHLAGSYEEGTISEKKTYNGFTVRVYNLKEIEINPVPEEHRSHFYDKQVRCRNFQFGFQQYNTTVDFINKS